MIAINNINFEFDLDIQFDQYLQITKNNNILSLDVNYCKIDIIGDIKQLALYFAVLMQGTFEVLDEEDMPFSAFIFSTAGKIITCRWQVKNIEQVNDFIKEYNRVYDTVELLK